MDNFNPTSPLFYLSRALHWMDKYGLKASMDLHTGPPQQQSYRKSVKTYNRTWLTEWLRQQW